MAIISSHTLNGIDGTHAVAIGVTLNNLRSNEMLFSTKTDDTGRLSQTVEITGRPSDTYELIFRAGDYWRDQGVAHSQLIEEIVLRLRIPDEHAHHHLPIILSPNSYSTWASAAE